MDIKLKGLGYEKDKEEIEEQLKVALETYTSPSSEEGKIVTAQKGGLQAYLELCKHHDLRTDASANKLRGEIMALGKPCKDRKEVKDSKTGLVPLSESLVTQYSFTFDTENVHRSYNPLKNSETSTLFENYPKCLI